MRATALLLALWWCAALPTSAGLSSRTLEGDHVQEDSRGLRGDVVPGKPQAEPTDRGSAKLRLLREKQAHIKSQSLKGKQTPSTADVRAGQSAHRNTTPATASRNHSTTPASALLTKFDTVVFMPTSAIQGVKLRILRELVRASPYPIVIAYDGAIDPATQSKLNSALLGSRAGVTVMSTNRDRLFSKYNATKVSNYNGIHVDNPAKLMVMDWFDSSKYEFLWHLEDDTWARGLDIIVSEWRSSKVDLLIRNESHLPFWAEAPNSTWRIGDRSKLPHGDFLHCNPAAFRMSRKFARSVLQAIQQSDTTNHHELWFPYVVQKYGLSWRPLTHSDYLWFNPHNESTMYDAGCITDLEANSKWLVHPVKCISASHFT